MNSDDIGRGVIPGLIAGYLFLAYTGSPPTLGIAAHIFISIVIGSIYTGVFMQYVDLGNPLVNIVVGGLLYGIIWWVVGWHIIMPAISGGNLLHLTLDTAFYAHLIFGHTLAFLVVLRDAALGMTWGNSYASYPRQKHPGGYIYNIRNPATGLTKIGRTIDPQQRLRKLRQEHGKQLEYKSLIKSDNAPKDENRLHKKHESKRKDGEWFDLN